MAKGEWNLYIIETECGKLYTGITKDVERHFEEHLSDKKGAKFFRSARPKKIVYAQRELSHSDALKMEIHIKKLSRNKKLALIKSRKSPFS